MKTQANDPFIIDVKTFLLKGILPDNTLGYRSKVEKCARDCFIDKNLIWINIVRPGRQPSIVLLAPKSLRHLFIDRYLSSMLDNSMTLDWEEQLPAMMMAYNCHVQ